MSDVASRIAAILDFAVAVALAASVVLVMLVFADLFTPPAGTVGTHPNYLTNSTKAAVFVGLLLSPTIGCAIAWPIHVCQQRRDQPVFPWLRFVVLASAVWTWFVFAALSDL
ncbi:hypothetical protein KZZ07_08635 [Mameliella sp. CS4]|uniref:hypothetical protein n=1 Tax=Mameliella sp. CS4 TaxID=2862329 RepID=UPI001C5E11B1|nr:hypothetical protein [Mameliella sp. CS4]MBW4982605.1 hypothetical protein [Mameliella sp. CS4]